MYSALLIAKYIIRRCMEQQTTISNLKLQKILYFVQAEFLADTGKCCFPERIEAWDYGPVVPEVYRAFRVYGSAQIPASVAEDVAGITREDEERINRIVDVCLPYGASQLVDLTHRQSPWLNAYEKGKKNLITTDSIRDFFAEA